MATTTKSAQAENVTQLPAENLPAPRTRQNAVQAIVPASWQEITAIAGAICRARMAPKSYLTRDGEPLPDKVAVAIMHGMEVGMTPMAALQSIAVINGMPSLYGDGLLAVIRGSGLLEDIEETIEYDEQGIPLSATCKMWRKGEKTPSVQMITRPQCIKAGWWNKDGPWKNTPHRMMQWRARGWCGRDKFADVLRGLHSAEEVQDMVDITPQATGPIPPEPKRGDHQEPSPGAKDPPNNSPPVTSPQTKPAGEDGQQGLPASEGVPTASSDTPAGVTDVVDENDITFEPWTTAGKFYEFSDTFLQSSATTPAMARKWEEFYRADILRIVQHDKQTVRAEMNDTLGLYHKKIAGEPQ